VKLNKIDSSQFNRSRWAQGSIHEIINGPCRYWNITKKQSKQLLRKYAIGYCDAREVLWKPQAGEIALMCFKDERHLWFHLREGEFYEVFGKLDEARSVDDGTNTRKK